MTPEEQKEYVLKRIHLIDNIQMSNELFKIKSEQFSEWLLKSFGFEMISKINSFFANAGEFWQFKYVDKL